MGACNSYCGNHMQHLVTRDPQRTTVGAAEVDVSRGDGATHAVVITASFVNTSVVADNVRVGVPMSGGLMPLAVLSPGHPTVVLHRSDVGSIITQPLRAISTVAGVVVTVVRSVAGAGEID